VLQRIDFVDASELKQIVEIFIHEADEALSQFEHCFLALERDGSNQLLLDRIFRTAHNLKGSSAALGFTEIAEFTHHFETFLQALRKKELVATPSVISTLFAARDFLASHLEALRTGKKSPGPGESIVHAFEREKEARNMPLRPIHLPRPAAAGDIWFVDDDLKAELFETPEPVSPKKSTMLSQPVDPRISAIQAEIARLTQLAAAVNLSTVQAADGLQVAALPVSQAEAWSLPGFLPPATDAEQDVDAASTLSTAVETSSSVEANENIEESAQETNEAVQSADSTLIPEDLESVATQSGVNEGDLPLETEGDEPQPGATALASDELEAATEEQPTGVDIPVVPEAPAPILDRPDNTLRVNLERVDKIITCIEELVILQSVLDEHKSEFTSPLLQKSVKQMSKIIREVQEVSMSIRMVSIRPVFLKLQRIVRETSLSLGKHVDAHFSGDETEIDKSILDKISDPLTHLVRNALDHGLESTEERAAVGKNPLGQIKIRAYQRSRAIVIEVSDDGRGLDSERIRAKAIQQGFIKATEKVSEEKLRSLIFHPGFSTKTEVSELSGRGVGLDVVSSNIQNLQGRVEVESSLGEGTTFRIVLPLTVAVMDGFIIRQGEERFVLAKTQIAETVRPHEADVNLVQGKTQLLNLRGATLPLYHLETLLHGKVSPKQATNTYDGIALVVTENQKHPFAIVVDDILAQQQVVIKKLGRELQGLSGLGGAAILGDGKPAIILDLSELVHAHQSGSVSQPRKGKVA
jgi:two-component system chemotaxis sensor kinase CheA